MGIRSPVESSEDSQKQHRAVYFVASARNDDSCTGALGFTRTFKVTCELSRIFKIKAASTSAREYRSLGNNIVGLLAEE